MENTSLRAELEQAREAYRQAKADEHGLQDQLTEAHRRVISAYYALQDLEAKVPPPTEEEQLQELVAQHAAPGVRWKTYPNDMRPGQFFVAEDRPIEPYPQSAVERSLLGTRYPAIPRG